ncbi:LysR substrate-binding domain-containing protein [Achromobacter aloeverae]|uniref:LysR family transcriptional regulator n=1 Tax=Achromobacter aloeverae TaxID=1750518 RepID=A0A4Q1HCE9_9BURK|nr:LysR substrate-binding domain-containing protein [Achromobacter aloeverae]RXN83335.1 LysR family transcriptional regulator [Achromobacter aloeverae]
MAKGVITHRMIEVFRAAIMHGGISAGAEALGIPQPSMSRVLTDLQKIVGFPLFLKSGRTVKPTAEAHALMEKVQQSFLGMDEIAKFSAQLRSQRLGRLSLCVIPSVGNSTIPQLMEHLSVAFPDVAVSVRIASYMDVWRHVLNRQADIGITADIVASGELETVAEFSGDCVCVGTSKWLPPCKSSITPQQLAGIPLIGLTDSFQRRLDALFSAHGVQPNSKIEVSASHTASELALRGMGVAIVDPLTGEHHRQRGGVVVALRPGLAYTVYATAMSDTRLGKPALEALRFLSNANERAKKHVIDG